MISFIVHRYMPEWFKYRIFLMRWKKVNPHNRVVPTNRFSINRVTIGKGSYGPITVKQWGHPKESLKIGDYCSISSGVKFILGGNHYYKCVSNFSFKNIYLDSSYPASSNGEICVEDGVWIGTDALIMSGVRIGKGSIIAAGSVVVKDVPPYSIVGGNPAKVIKFRFNEDILRRLVRLKMYENITKELYLNNRELFDNEMDLEILSKLEDIFNK